MSNACIESPIKLNFTFTINGNQRFSNIATSVEHSQGIICFSLPYKLTMTIQNAYLISREQKDSKYVYIYEFNSLNEALEWIENKEIDVEQGFKTGDVYEIQKEMDLFMQKYEETEGKKKRKTKKVDEDGFSYFN